MVAGLLPLPLMFVRTQGVQQTVCVGSGAVAASPVPPAKIEFDPNREAPHLSAVRAAKRHARDIHPNVRGAMPARDLKPSANVFKEM